MRTGIGLAPETRIVIISPDAGLAAFLQMQLPPSTYEVVTVTPGAGLLEVARAGPPAIAVIDRVDERPEAAATEIALLKDRSPDVRVIAMSDRSTPADAGVLEQGVFFYLAARPRTDLVRLIHAAGQREYRSVGVAS